MNKPYLSVIMAMFNEERYIKSTIESILNQTYNNYELIIVDDNSTDKSREICESFRDPRIRIYSKGDRQKGAAESRNIAIKKAEGEYIIIHDADDYSEPTRFEIQVAKALENPGKRVVGCSVNIVKNEKYYVLKKPENHDEICKGFNRMINRATIVAGTILAPRQLMLDVPYRKKFKYIEDWDLLLRIHEKSDIEFYNCQDVLYTYYLRSDGVVNKPDWLDYNIWIRNCQKRRKKNLAEFSSLADFYDYLKFHPFERFYWFTMKWLINLKLNLRKTKLWSRVFRIS